MHRLSVQKIEVVENEERYGRFKIEPLDRGIGVTLGNTFRRMLQAYLPGAAIVSAKIEGVQHEFTTIPDVKEDVSEFLLNVRGVRIKSISGNVGKLRLEVEGEREVTAGDIQNTDDFEVVNPELHLATLDSADAKLNVEFDVDLGVGYQEADSENLASIGAIPLDAVFTPIKKVNFTIEPVHVGRETSKERLYLEIWTDGTIKPVDALSDVAQMLTELIEPFVHFAQAVKLGEQEVEEEPVVQDEKFSIAIGELELSVRTLNALRRAGISTVGELVSKSEKELLSLRNFGQVSKQEVAEKLSSLGLSLMSDNDETEETDEE